MTTPMPSPAMLGVVSCPGLKVTANAGVFFTDSLGRVHDLERAHTVRPKEAAADARLCGAPVAEVLRMIRTGELYPVLKRNERVILIFDCALTDWRARQLTTQPLKRGLRTLGEAGLYAVACHDINASGASAAVERRLNTLPMRDQVSIAAGVMAKFARTKKRAAVSGGRAQLELSAQ